MFTDDDLLIRPQPLDKRDRNPLEHMVHQCMSEDKWFCTMFGIDVGAPPLPGTETRLEFIKRYAEDSGKRLEILKEKDKTWWEQEVSFFEAQRIENLGYGEKDSSYSAAPGRTDGFAENVGKRNP